MPVSSDTLFHYTKSLRNLKSILQKKFLLTYCRENVSLDHDGFEAYYPMVSFCDIPLSLAKAHIYQYGSYAIGMTKRWGIRNGLNPVVYIEKDSILAKDILASTENLYEVFESNKEQLKKVYKSIENQSKIMGETIERELKNESPESNALLKKHRESIAIVLRDQRELVQRMEKQNEIIKGTAIKSYGIFRYMKNYNGTVRRKKKDIINYSFYNEREWRFVPALNDIKHEISADQYATYRGLSKKKPFISSVNLPFSSEDIKYLIVKTSKDIPHLIDFIRKNNNLIQTADNKDILTAKILTIEQLTEDF